MRPIPRHKVTELKNENANITLFMRGKCTATIKFQLLDKDDFEKSWIELLKRDNYHIEHPDLLKTRGSRYIVVDNRAKFAQRQFELTDKIGLFIFSYKITRRNPPKYTARLIRATGPNKSTKGHLVQDTPSCDKATMTLTCVANARQGRLQKAKTWFPPQGQSLMETRGTDGAPIAGSSLGNGNVPNPGFYWGRQNFIPNVQSSRITHGNPMQRAPHFQPNPSAYPNGSGGYNNNFGQAGWQQGFGAAGSNSGPYNGGNQLQ